MSREGKEQLRDPELFDGIDGDEERAARRDLLEYLLRAGADVDDLKAAARERRLATLPVELTLKAPERYTLTELGRAAKIETKFLRSVLLSLGHPNPGRGERIFTDEDLEVARVLRRFLDGGLSRADVLSVSRVLGQALAQMAGVLREIAGNALIRPGDSEHSLGLRYAAAADELVPLLGDVIHHELRVHLREQATRDVITRAEREAGELSETREIAICFADLSHFTRLGETRPTEEIAAVGLRMTTLAAEVALRPVELVKTIGDGVMLVSSSVPALLTAVGELAERTHAEGDDFPPMRAGIAYGPAVNRAADWFGPPVNRASRIVDVAKSGTVLVEEPIQERAGPSFDWSKRRLPKGLRGVSGRTRLYRLHLATDDR